MAMGGALRRRLLQSTDFTPGMDARLSAPISRENFVKLDSRIRPAAFVATLAAILSPLSMFSTTAEEIKSSQSYGSRIAASAKITVCDAFLGSKIMDGTYGVEDVVAALGNKSFDDVGPCGVVRFLTESAG